MSDPTTETKPRRPGRGLRLALIASMMLNVLVIGVLAGGFWHNAQVERMTSGAPDIRAVWRAMPATARDAAGDGAFAGVRGRARTAHGP